MAEGKVQPPMYGLLAEFETPEQLIEAVHDTRDAGYTKIDAYTPYPVHGLAQALNFRKTWIPEIVLGGGLTGLVAGLALQYWVAVLQYPMNIGGKPLASFPAFMVPAFETTILFAAFGAVFGMLALNGLPQPYHPLFNIERFARASQDRFFLAIHASDPQFNLPETRRFLLGLGAYEVSDVPH
ncbi:MAG: DUF3341 domain-containing protein [Anaerolineae bacterium]|nr:DUF3341 domain-containing protein [Anaerolineae bacterium]